MCITSYFVAANTDSQTRIFDSIAIIRCVDILGHKIWGGRRRMSVTSAAQSVGGSGPPALDRGKTDGLGGVDNHMSAHFHMIILFAMMRLFLDTKHMEIGISDVTALSVPSYCGTCSTSSSRASYVHTTGPSRFVTATRNSLCCSWLLQVERYNADAQTMTAPRARKCLIVL